MDTHPPLQILYEDNHLLAVVKPQGMLTQGDRTGDATLLERAKAYIKEKYRKPGEVFLGLVHRLDRPTGGVVVFARTSKAAGRLSSQFRERQVKKHYLALCQGVPDSPARTLTHSIIFDQTSRRALVTPEGGKEAVLSFRVLAGGSDSCLLDVKPRTGRKHQIRVQLAAIGHPIVGDQKYAARKSDGGIVRAIGLWASKLELTHPVKKTPLTFTCLPDVDTEPWHRFTSELKSLSPVQGRE